MDALGVVSARYAPLNKGHVTTRENVQFHHVKLGDTPDFMRLIGDEGLSTREACGNTVRNVTGCPLAGVCADEPFDVTPVRCRILALLRQASVHPGPAAQVEDGLLRAARRTAP